MFFYRNLRPVVDQELRVCFLKSLKRSITAHINATGERCNDGYWCFISLIGLDFTWLN
jgi:hypothetical protein